MSTMLPARASDRTWIVSAEGVAVQCKALAKELTSGQRHYQYRLGLMVVDQFLKARGFEPNATESGTTLSYEKSGVWLDLQVKRPDNVAYVTSYPGYVYKQDDSKDWPHKVKAKVITAKDVLGSDYVVQIVVSTADNVGTRAPVFVPLPKTLRHPGRHVVKNVLGTLALMCSAIPKMQEAFNKKDVEAAQNVPVEDLITDSQPLPLLPD